MYRTKAWRGATYAPPVFLFVLVLACFMFPYAKRPEMVRDPAVWVVLVLLGAGLGLVVAGGVFAGVYAWQRRLVRRLPADRGVLGDPRLVVGQDGLVETGPAAETKIA